MARSSRCAVPSGALAMSAWLALAAACGQEPASEAPGAPPPVAAESAAPAGTSAGRPTPNPQRNAYFGAVHVHTSYSFDAFTNGTVSKPGDAYDWARSKPIQGNKSGLMLQIRTPLDFYAVSDHAEMMGVLPRMTDPADPLSKNPIAARVLPQDPNVSPR